MTEPLPNPTDEWLDQTFADFLQDPNALLDARPRSGPVEERASAVHPLDLVRLMIDASLEGADLPRDLPLRAQLLKVGEAGVRGVWWEAVERVPDGAESAFEKRYFPELRKSLQRSLGKPFFKTKQVLRFARGDGGASVSVERGAEKMRNPLGDKMPWTLHRLKIHVIDPA